MRPSGRATDQLRPVSLEIGVNKHAEGSCLVRFGDTQVLCTASIEENVPPWLRKSGKGWVTAEYGMLPRATTTRTNREAARGKQSGRTQEIQRLIGRSLRAVTDLKAMGEIQITGPGIQCSFHHCTIAKEYRTTSGKDITFYNTADLHCFTCCPQVSCHFAFYFNVLAKCPHVIAGGTFEPYRSGKYIQITLGMAGEFKIAVSIASVGVGGNDDGITVNSIIYCRLDGRVF